MVSIVSFRLQIIQKAKKELKLKQLSFYYA